MTWEPRVAHRIPRRYRTILADPPWDASTAKSALPPIHRGPSDLGQLKALPVGELAQPDAYLWMWCTTATLQVAYQLLEAWTFTPRAPLTWIKPCPGLGPHLRSNTEHLILGTRGHAEVNQHGQPAWLFAPAHDAGNRCDEEYAVIERVCTGPYLELFAGKPRQGWDTWSGRLDPSDHRADSAMPPLRV
ncbi:MT-A70 family methyltransferase [Nocardia goodfellowii]